MKSDLLEFYTCTGLGNLCDNNESVSGYVVKTGLVPLLNILQDNDKPKCQYAATKLLLIISDSSSELKNEIKNQIQQNKNIFENLEKLKEAKDNRIVDIVVKALKYFYE